MWHLCRRDDFGKEIRCITVKIPVNPAFMIVLVIVLHCFMFCFDHKVCSNLKYFNYSLTIYIVNHSMSYCNAGSHTASFFLSCNWNKSKYSNKCNKKKSNIVIITKIVPSSSQTFPSLRLTEKHDGQQVESALLFIILSIKTLLTDQEVLALRRNRVSCSHVRTRIRFDVNFLSLPKKPCRGQKLHIIAPSSGWKCFIIIVLLSLNFAHNTSKQADETFGYFWHFYRLLLLMTCWFLGENTHFVLVINIWRCWHWPSPKKSTSWSRCSFDAEGFGGSRPDKPGLYWSNLRQKQTTYDIQEA